jgi:hypothetical protein
VKPLDDQSVFAYCENCGIVYALNDRLKGALDIETPGRFGAGITGEKGTNRPGGVSGFDVTAPTQSPGSYWRCPDCDTEIHSDNDSDLEFVKREHVREYHPNRSTG